MGRYLDRRRTIEQAAAEGMIDELRGLVEAWKRAETTSLPADEEDEAVLALDRQLATVMPRLAERIAVYDDAADTEAEDFRPGGSG